MIERAASAGSRKGRGDRVPSLLVWLAVPVVLTLIVPRRHFAHYLGWLGMLAVVVLLDLARPQDGGAGYALWLGVLYLAALATGGAVVVRLVAFALLEPRRRGAADASREGVGGTSSAMTCLQLACAGVLTALVVLWILAGAIQGFRPAWVVHAIVLGLAAGACAVALRKPALSAQAARNVAGLRLWAGALGGALALAAAASAVYPVVVARQAEAVAGAAPYCIQTAEWRGTEYQPARTWLDLSGLTMQAKANYRSSIYLQHHAILVVGEVERPRLFHWSHRRRSFIEGVFNEPGYGPALYCVPQHGFVQHLPTMLGGTNREPLYVRLAGRAYRIPLAYHPKVSGGDNTSLWLAAVAPDFALLGPSWGHLTRTERLYRSVFIDFRPEGWFDALTGISSDEVVEERGEAFGLRVRAVSHRGSSARIEYYAPGSGERPRTLVSCWRQTAANPLPCQHWFVHRGWMFTFRHRLSDLPSWRPMQQRLIGLLESFVVAESGTPSHR
jgi:hypothetical protein